MPTISVNRNLLFKLLGQKYSKFYLNLFKIKRTIFKS